MGACLAFLRNLTNVLLVQFEKIYQVITYETDEVFHWVYYYFFLSNMYLLYQI